MGESIANSQIALSVDKVSYSYPTTLALNDVSFSIKAGSFTVLLGANGAGKTTLYSLATRLFNTQTGNIHIFGLHLKKNSSQALKKIGVVFQRQTLDVDLTVKQNLRYHAALHGLKRKDAIERVNLRMEKHELIDFADRKVNQLSGGQRRRIEIARALIHEPRLLLLDEPTVGLDIQSRQDFITHTRSLCKEDGVSVMWSTHLIDEVYPDDSLIVLRKGEVADVGMVAEVLKRTATNSVAEAFHKLNNAESNSE